MNNEQWRVACDMCEKISSFNSGGRVSNVDIVMSFAGFEAPNLTGLLGEVSYRLKGDGRN